jgi:hypothetical protein
MTTSIKGQAGYQVRRGAAIFRICCKMVTYPLQMPSLELEVRCFEKSENEASDALVIFTSLRSALKVAGERGSLSISDSFQ